MINLNLKFNDVMEEYVETKSIKYLIKAIRYFKTLENEKVKIKFKLKGEKENG